MADQHIPEIILKGSCLLTFLFILCLFMSYPRRAYRPTHKTNRKREAPADVNAKASLTRQHLYFLLSKTGLTTLCICH